MNDLLSASLIGTLLCGGAAFGHKLLDWLPERHRTRETLDFTRLVAGLLVTFAALVLSLLLASVNTAFEKTENDLQTYSADLIRLTSELDAYGSAATKPIQADIRRYVAAAIKSTWPSEPAPPGDYPDARSNPDTFESSVLGGLLDKAGRALRTLEAPDSMHADLRAQCLARLDRILDERWTLINEARRSITEPFFHVLVFWLLVVFISFGLSAPRNMLSAVFMLMTALAVSSAVFVIGELDGPLDGVIKVSSEPLRHALRHLDYSLGTLPAPD